MELALTKFNPMVKNALAFNDEVSGELIEKYDHAVRVGARHLAKNVKKMVLGYILKKQNMNLLEVSRRDIDGDRMVWIWDETGRKRITTKYSNWWQISKINKFKGDIPIEVLTNLPNNAYQKAKILEPKEGNDPYVAIKIKGSFGRQKYYVAVAQWD
ncbi:MAG: hypothetical protein ACXACY_26590 [Candidatus Hodarchaeales archaeon]|jgi:hypothetical protein